MKTIQLLLFLFTMSLYSHPFDCIPNYVFTIEKLDYENKIVFLNALKKTETGLQTIDKVRINHPRFFWCPIGFECKIDDTIYRIAEDEYAIGVNVYDSSPGTGGGSEIQQLQLFQFKSNALKNIFSGTLRKNVCMYGHDKKGMGGTEEISEATLAISPNLTLGYYDLVLTTKEHISHETYDAEDGFYNHVHSNSTTTNRTEAYAWDGDSYRKK